MCGVACGKGIHGVPVGRWFDRLSNFISQRNSSCYGGDPRRIVPVISVSSSNSSRLMIRGISPRCFLQEGEPVPCPPLAPMNRNFMARLAVLLCTRRTARVIIHMTRTLRTRRQKSRKLVPKVVCLLQRGSFDTVCSGRRENLYAVAKKEKRGETF